MALNRIVRVNAIRVPPRAIRQAFRPLSAPTTPLPLPRRPSQRPTFRVAADQTFTTTAAPPAATSPPTISGSPTQGQTLSEAHGAYTNSPTGFAYQWEDCDTTGNNCVAIPGATAQSYVLGGSDVGHTIRVLETASNTAGASAPNPSNATGVVAAGSLPAVTVITEKAGSVTSTAATLHGVIDTKGLAVTWQFQYGHSLTYNEATPIQTIAAGSTKPASVSRPVIHLSPNTLYHVRLVAIVSRGATQKPLVSDGNDQSFTTRPVGKLLLNRNRLRVAGGDVFVALTCQSKLKCSGRFSITTRALVGKRHRQHLGIVLCASTFTTITAGASKTVKTKLSRPCLSLITQAGHHQIKGQFTSRFRTGQLGIIKNITLYLTALR